MESAVEWVVMADGPMLLGHITKNKDYQQDGYLKQLIGANHIAFLHVIIIHKESINHVEL